MKRIQKIALVLLALGFASRPVHGALAVISSVTSPSGEGGYGSAMIDTANDFMAFGSSTPFDAGLFQFSYLAEIQISTFTYISRTHFFNDLVNLQSVAFDPTNGYSYWSSSGTTPGLQKLHLAAPITASSATYLSGTQPIGTGVLDTTNQFGYFGTATSPSVILKVDLSDLTLVSTITLPSGLEYLSASVIDSQNNFAYFGSSTTTGAVAKIKLSDFTLAGTLTFNSGEGGVASAVIDNTSGFAYFGTHDSPGKIVKVRLESLTRAGAQTLQNGENDLTSAVIDPAISLAVFGTNTSTGILIPIHLVDFSKGTSLTMGAGENYLRSAVIDTTNDFAYFGSYATPGVVTQVDLLFGLPEVFVQPRDAIIHPGEIVTLAILAEGRGMTYQWQKNGTDISGATLASYTFTAASTDDQSVFRCVVTNSFGSTASSGATVTIIPIVKAFPNPWRVDRHAGLNITFDGMLPNATLKIFNVAAHWVRTLPTGANTWDLKNDAGQTVASGYYYFLSTTGNENQKSRGTIAIIR